MAIPGSLSSSKVGVSLVIPVFNSETTLLQFFEGISKFATSFDFDLEVVFVDDASTDGTVTVLQNIQVHAPNAVVVKHQFNRGQPKATLTGVFAARNEIVVTLDDDLQHRPADIPRLLEPLLHSGPSTLVMAIAATRNRARWRTIIGVCANAVTNLFLSKPIPLRLTNFCAFDRQLCAHLDPNADYDVAVFTEMVQAARETLTVPVNLDASIRRESRYNFARLVRLFITRASCFKLSRVIFWLVCSAVMTLASASLLLAQSAIPLCIALPLIGACVVPPLILTLLAIKVLRARTAFRRIHRSA